MAQKLTSISLCINRAPEVARSSLIAEAEMQQYYLIAYEQAVVPERRIWLNDRELDMEIERQLTAKRFALPVTPDVHQKLASICQRIRETWVANYRIMFVIPIRNEGRQMIPEYRHENATANTREPWKAVMPDAAHQATGIATTVGENQRALVPIATNNLSASSAHARDHQRAPVPNAASRDNAGDRHKALVPYVGYSCTTAVSNVGDHQNAVFPNASFEAMPLGVATDFTFRPPNGGPNPFTLAARDMDQANFWAAHQISLTQRRARPDIPDASMVPYFSRYKRLEDIYTERKRKDVRELREVMENESVARCMEALWRCEDNFLDAIEWLRSTPHDRRLQPIVAVDDLEEDEVIKRSVTDRPPAKKQKMSTVSAVTKWKSPPQQTSQKASKASGKGAKAAKEKKKKRGKPQTRYFSLKGGQPKVLDPTLDPDSMLESVTFKDGRRVSLRVKEFSNTMSQSVREGNTNGLRHSPAYSPFAREGNLIKRRLSPSYSPYQWEHQPSKPMSRLMPALPAPSFERNDDFIPLNDSPVPMGANSENNGCKDDPSAYATRRSLSIIDLEASKHHDDSLILPQLSGGSSHQVKTVTTRQLQISLCSSLTLIQQDVIDLTGDDENEKATSKTSLKSTKAYIDLTAVDDCENAIPDDANKIPKSSGSSANPTQSVSQSGGQLKKQSSLVSIARKGLESMFMIDKLFNSKSKGQKKEAELSPAESASSAAQDEPLYETAPEGNAGVVEAPTREQIWSVFNID